MRTITQSAFIGVDLVTTMKPAPVIPRGDRKRVARVLHLGAGRQSSWLAEAMVEGELEPATFAIFADTGDEPPWVYGQVGYLRDRLALINVPLFIVRRSERGMVGDIQYNVDQRFASLPLFTRGADGERGRIKRQCTSEYKIAPSDSALLDWMVAHGHARVVTDKHGRASRRVARGVYTQNVYGISFEEFYRAGKRGASWQVADYPLIDRRMTAQACVDWLKARGLPVPQKSACIVCPFHDNGYWLWLKTEAPPEFEHACQFDDWLRSPEAKSRKQLKGLRQDCYLHESLVPLRLVDFAKIAAEKAHAPLLDLCGDYCMT